MPFGKSSGFSHKKRQTQEAPKYSACKLYMAGVDLGYLTLVYKAECCGALGNARQVLANASEQQLELQ